MKSDTTRMFHFSWVFNQSELSDTSYNEYVNHRARQSLGNLVFNCLEESPDTYLIALLPTEESPHKYDHELTIRVWTVKVKRVAL